MKIFLRYLTLVLVCFYIAGPAAFAAEVKGTEKKRSCGQSTTRLKPVYLFQFTTESQQAPDSYFQAEEEEEESSEKDLKNGYPFIGFSQSFKVPVLYLASRVAYFSSESRLLPSEHAYLLYCSFRI